MGDQRTIDFSLNQRTNYWFQTRRTMRWQCLSQIYFWDLSAWWSSWWSLLFPLIIRSISENHLSRNAVLQALSKVFISTFYQIRLKSHNDNKRNPLLLCKLYLPWLILFKLLSCVTSGLLPRIACQRFHKVTQVTKKAFERLLPSVYLIVDSQTTFLWLVLTTLAALISFFHCHFIVCASPNGFWKHFQIRIHCISRASLQYASTCASSDYLHQMR